MQQIAEVSRAVAGMPVPALIAMVILAGFGLSAYAISAVVKVSKGRRNGR